MNERKKGAILELQRVKTEIISRLEKSIKDPDTRFLVYRLAVLDTVHHQELFAIASKEK